jgi:hypothetical protein
MRVPTAGERVDVGPSAGDGVTVPSRSAATVRRPPAVTILAVVQLLNAAVYGLVLAGLLVGGSEVLAQVLGDAASTDGLLGEVEVVTVTAVVGGLFVAALAAGVLLLRMTQLGWTITMLLAGIGLATSIYLWWAQGATVEIWVIVQIVTVFYLNQRQVREAFDISRRDAVGMQAEADR